MSRRRQLLRWGAVAGLAAFACQTLSGKSELAGTSWQLVEIQSMDDTTLRPDDSAKYTLAFGEDGKVAARADCNRGAGTWTSEGTSQVVFGQFATTRAMCPPNSLEPRFWRDLGFVRSYVLKDGRLYLSLMADGGIYVFARLGAAVRNTPPATAVLFRCEGLAEPVTATFIGSAPPRALIRRAGNEIPMQIARSGSGTRYEGLLPDQFFWERRGEARYREGSDSPQRVCKADTGGKTK